ncbi:retrovirus-related Pol polyprotein from transposon opus [Trichonephila clavata]|uniref:Retrovirus-related Pol polyprotein from transposon opus n=1 Tax=Trichonephila clavata TaxID=2740835 RepID=A0A8X6JPA5_TRICU|nr:retrovirus-related Pol polyprotein from transposon opus [Trichonephila clavata]
MIYKMPIETPELILKEFADVFTVTGRLNRIVKIKLKENSVPHVAAPRKVPLAIHNKVKEELNNMVEAGIISKVEEPTEWVNNMVVIDSPNELRICLDPRPLNEAIQRPYYPIPTPDGLVTKLQGGKVFTILDAKNGFWQLPLHEESSYLTTFCTPWGRYRFLVLPFGLNSAPEEFQKAMDDIYKEDEDINPYFDDIALGSSTVEEHWRLLRRTLLKASKANLKFNELKTQLSQTSINYLGHVLSDEGIKPDPKKISAIEQFATPNCKEDLQRFLEMVSNMCPNAKICQKYQRENQKEILSNPETPGRPWQKVACDFFCLKGKEHLLMIDYLSKYVELKPLNNITAQSVITVMKSIYATHGIPEDLVSDGGPPFNSNLMTNFFREWGIKHHVTTPHFPRANGQIEREQCKQ